MTLQEKFDRHLSWCYGDKAKLKASLEEAAAKYRQSPNQSAFVLARINQYEMLSAMCDEPKDKQLTLF